MSARKQQRQAAKWSGELMLGWVGRYADLHKQGREFRGSCPFCGAANDALSVGPKGTGWRARCYRGCLDAGDKKGSDVFGFVQRALGVGFPEAERLVLDGAEFPDDATAVEERIAREARQAQSDDERCWNDAAALWAKAVDITDTPAERYLTGRGLPGPWSNDLVRWHPGREAMLAPLTNGIDQIRNLEQAFLLPGGQPRTIKRKAMFLKDRRSTPGSRRGAVFRIRGDQDGPRLHADAIADVLTATRAIPGIDAVSTCGAAVTSTELAAPPRLNLVLADDDRIGGPAETELLKFVATKKAEGFRIAIAYARDERLGDGFDWNDLLQQEGLEAVRHRLKRALLGAGAAIKIAPPFKLGEASAAEARSANRRAVDHVLSQRGEHADPLTVLLPGGSGSGKSTAIREASAEIERARGNRRRRKSLERTLLTLNNPHQEYGRQVVAELREAGICAVVVPGVEGVCKFPKEVQAVRDAGESVESVMCPKCPLRAECAHAQALDQTVRPETGAVIVASAMLSYPLPPRLERATRAPGIAAPCASPTGKPGQPTDGLCVLR